MATYSNISALLTGLTVYLTGEEDLPAAPAQDLGTVLVFAGALPQGSYTVYNHDDLAPPAALEDLQGTQVAVWSNDQLGNVGYGNLEMLATPAGPGMLFSYAGTSMSGASSVWVVPANAYSA